MDQVPVTEQPISPQPAQTNKKIGLITAGTALLSALVVGGVVYTYQNMQADNAKDDLNTEIVALQSQLAVINSATPSPTSTPAATATATATPAATQNTYTNTTFGFSLKYPLSWRVINDTIQKDAAMESKPGESATLALSQDGGGPSITVIAYHGGFGPEISKISFKGSFANGKLSLTDREVGEGDVYQPVEGTIQVSFKQGDKPFFIKGIELTEQEFIDIATTFRFN